MDGGDFPAFIIPGVLKSKTHNAPGARYGYRLDADPGIRFDAHPFEFLDRLDQAMNFVGPLGEFDPGV